MDLAISPMKVDDLREAVDLFKNVNPLAKEQEIENWTRAALKECSSCCFVLRDPSTKICLGAITVGLREGRVPFVEDLFLREHIRGLGYGSMLLEGALSGLKKMGVTFVKVEALPAEFPLAMKFYYKHNFRVCGVEQDRFGEGPLGDAVILKKTL